MLHHSTHHRRVVTILVLAVGTGLIAVPARSPAEVTQAKEKPAGKRPANPALQPVEDVPGLPRVLLIGDSISIGYTVPVREKLRGTANVHRPLANCGPTTSGLANLDAWLATGGADKTWDVIHFNWGLHDLKFMGPNGENLADPAAPTSRRQVPPEDYRTNLTALVERLQKTGAKLVWRTTTPVPKGAKGRLPDDVAVYNTIAHDIMTRAGVPTHDLFTFAQKRLEQIQKPADVHFTPEGSDVLAADVAREIRAALPAPASGTTGAARPKGIVWIVADDMSPDIAAYGALGVATPNLDRLAREGRRFTRAYATAPVCSSSRSAFIIGSYQTTTGLHPHDIENPQPLRPPFTPLPTLLRAAGWFVTNAPAPGTTRSGRAIRHGKTHYNFAHDSATLFDGDDWRQRRPGQPFFAQYQILEPHRAFPVPESFDEAALAAIPLPANYPDHPLVRRDWYAYLRSVEMVDRRVGAILAELEAEGVLDDTLVVFFADHGRPMPWGKQWLTVEGLRVPLLVRGPGVPAGGVTEGVVSLVDLAPSALATAALPVPAWMEGLPVVHGAAASPPADRAVFAARDRCGDAPDRSRAVITADSLLVRNFLTDLPRLAWSSYKESSYPGMPLVRTLAARGALTPLQAAWLAPTRPAVELYDLRDDPLGLHDVAGDPQRAPRRAALETRLDDWIARSGDTGAAGDPPTEPPLAEIQKQKRADYARVWKKRIGLENPGDAAKLAWWLATYALAEPAADDDFRRLFNGRDLTGWDGNPELWTVEDGCITGRTTGPDHLAFNQFLVWRGGTPANFELRARIRQQGNNAGIQYRSRELPEVGRWSVGGYQCDVHPVAANNAMVYEERGRGIIVQNGQSVVVDPEGVRWVVGEWGPVAVDVDGWHEYAIIARGNRLIHMIDGRKTIELVDHEEGKRSLEGLLAFQIHRGPAMEVQIKDVRLKELPAGDVVAFDKAAIPADARRLEKPKPRPKPAAKPQAAAAAQ